VCKKEARNSSIYCSDACILAHAQETLTKDKPVPTGSNIKSAKSPVTETIKAKPETRVIVFDKKNGKVLTGKFSYIYVNVKYKYMDVYMTCNFVNYHYFRRGCSDENQFANVAEGKSNLRSSRSQYYQYTSNRWKARHANPNIWKNCMCTIKLDFYFVLNLTTIRKTLKQVFRLSMFLLIKYLKL